MSLQSYRVHGRISEDYLKVMSTSNDTLNSVPLLIDLLVVLGCHAVRLRWPGVNKWLYVYLSCCFNVMEPVDIVVLWDGEVCLSY